IQGREESNDPRGFRSFTVASYSPGPAVRGKGSCQPLISLRQGQLLSLLPR
ncbi:unnamed protein product, partial [Heterotrigona itama]